MKTNNPCNLVPFTYNRWRCIVVNLLKTSVSEPIRIGFIIFFLHFYLEFSVFYRVHRNEVFYRALLRNKYKRW